MDNFYFQQLILVSRVLVRDDRNNNHQRVANETNLYLYAMWIMDQ